jgi:hypothetical protein
MKCETIQYLIDDDVLNVSKNYPVRTLVISGGFGLP